MKALSLTELRDLLQGGTFAAWWAELSRAHVELRDAGARHRELLSQAELMELRAELVQRTAMDAFSDGGLAEEEAARAAARAQELENRALTLVGHYEEQRFRTSDIWYRLGGSERSIEESADAVARKALEKQLQALQQEYAVEDRKRDRLWAEVEEAWEAAFEQSLLAHEHSDRSRRIRKEAERLFEEAEDRKQRSRQLRGEAEAADRERGAAGDRQAKLLERARHELGCAAGERFLYWRHREDKRAAFAVALVDDAEAYNLPVKALSIYAVGPKRGVAFLEQPREGLARTVEHGDRRFEEYLLGPRQGVRRGEGGSGGTTP
jgi:hypothetical protein